MPKIEENHSLKQAKAQFESIKEMVENYRKANEQYYYIIA